MPHVTVLFEAVNDTPRGAGVEVGDGLGVGVGVLLAVGDADVDGDVEAVGDGWIKTETPPTDGPANAMARVDIAAITASQTRARRRTEEVTVGGKIASYERDPVRYRSA